MADLPFHSLTPERQNQLCLMLKYDLPEPQDFPSGPFHVRLLAVDHTYFFHINLLQPDINRRQMMVEMDTRLRSEYVSARILVPYDILEPEMLVVVRTGSEKVGYSPHFQRARVLRKERNSVVCSAIDSFKIVKVPHQDVFFPKMMSVQNPPLAVKVEVKGLELFYGMDLVRKAWELLTVDQQGPTFQAVYCWRVLGVPCLQLRLDSTGEDLAELIRRKIPLVALPPTLAPQADEMTEVTITHVEEDGSLWFQRKDDPLLEIVLTFADTLDPVALIEQRSQNTEQVYQNLNNPGTVFAAPFLEDGKYYRASVKKVINPQKLVEMTFVDFGNSCPAPVDKLLMLDLIDKSLKSVPPRAQGANLGGLTSVDPDVIWDYLLDATVTKCHLKVMDARHEGGRVDVDLLLDYVNGKQKSVMSLLHSIRPPAIANGCVAKLAHVEETPTDQAYQVVGEVEAEAFYDTVDCKNMSRRLGAANPTKEWITRKSLKPNPINSQLQQFTQRQNSESHVQKVSVPMQTFESLTEERQNQLCVMLKYNLPELSDFPAGPFHVRLLAVDHTYFFHINLLEPDTTRRQMMVEMDTRLRSEYVSARILVPYDILEPEMLVVVRTGSEKVGYSPHFQRARVLRKERNSVVCSAIDSFKIVKVPHQDVFFPKMMSVQNPPLAVKVEVKGLELFYGMDLVRKAWELLTVDQQGPTFQAVYCWRVLGVPCLQLRLDSTGEDLAELIRRKIPLVALPPTLAPQADEMTEVTITHVEEDGSLWFQRKDDPLLEIVLTFADTLDPVALIEQRSQNTEQVYQNLNNPGTVFAAPFLEDGKYYRASVKKVINPQKLVEMTFVDFGNSCPALVDKLLMLDLIDKSLKSVPPRAQGANLGGLTSVDPDVIWDYLLDATVTKCHLKVMGGRDNGGRVEVDLVLDYVNGEEKSMLGLLNGVASNGKEDVIWCTNGVEFRM